MVVVMAVVDAEQQVKLTSQPDILVLSHLCGDGQGECSSLHMSCQWNNHLVDEKY